MSDHDKLREAIEEAKSVANGQTFYSEITASFGFVVLRKNDAEILVAAAESTLPKTKMVEVWRVEFARMGSSGEWLPDSTSCDHASGYFTREAAEAELFNIMRDQHEEYRCIRVTGPHQQEVPA